MAFLDSFAKKAKLKSAIKLTNAARKAEGEKAEQLFKRAYQDFSGAIQKDLLLAEALYNWGFALLHNASIRSGEDAVKTYQEAIEKFNFCMIIDPNYLAAAIDGGVAYMDLARIKSLGAGDLLYEMAMMQFKKANAIQAGSASYNIACIYGLRSDSDKCQRYLEESRDNGSLPDKEAIQFDSDLGNINHEYWFMKFMESLDIQPEPEEKPEPAVAEAVETESKPAVESVAKTVVDEPAKVEAAPKPPVVDVAKQDDKPQETKNYGYGAQHVVNTAVPTYGSTTSVESDKQDNTKS